MRTIKVIMCMMIVSAAFLPLAVQGYEGRVLNTDASLVTVKISQLDEDLTGATVEMTYMAGMLPMALGSFKVKSCLLGVVGLTPVSVTMTPSKDMKVILDLVPGMESRDQASPGPVTGTVIGLDNDNVKIEITGPGEIEPDKLGSKEEAVNKEKFTQKGMSTLEQAAKQGDASAQNKLGRNYQKGINVNQDYQTAVFWYKKAAKNGNEFARTNLKNMGENF